MNETHFAEWLKLQNFRVIKTASSYWYNAGTRVLQAFPYHWIIQPGEEEIRTLMRENGIFALRYSAPVQSIHGKISYQTLYDDKNCNLDQLDRRSRQNVKRGLNNCIVERIPFERLANEGYVLECDTMKRQRRPGDQDEIAWRKRCFAAGQIPGFVAWGAIVDGRLAASLLAFEYDDCCELLYQQCHRDYLCMRVNNALTFSVTQTMIQRKNIKYVFYGLQSLDASSQIDEYKFRMGYQAKQIRQRVVFHPMLQFAANKTSHIILRWLLNMKPQSRTLSKAEGMFRFYLQGNLDLEKQDWPTQLEKKNHAIPEGRMFKT